MEEKMIDSTLAEEAVNEEAVEKVDNEALEVPEKKFSQEDVDKIIQKKTAKHYEKLSSYKALSKLISEVGGVEGETPEEQIAFLENYYKSKDGDGAAEQKAKKPDETKSYVKALKFSNKANDEQVYEEVQRILNTPAKRRDADDLALLEALENRYKHIAFKKEYNEAKKVYDGDLDALLKDENFNEFAEGNNLPLKKLVAKYVKLTGAGKKKEDTAVSKSMGSVKTSGTAVVKEYYTPEEVDKLTDKDLDDPKVWEAVRKSMCKWKK